MHRPVVKGGGAGVAELLLIHACQLTERALNADADGLPDYHPRLKHVCCVIDRFESMSHGCSDWRSWMWWVLLSRRLSDSCSPTTTRWHFVRAATALH